MNDESRPTDRRPAHDPTRALDAVTPPDQWADITARSTHGGGSGAPLAIADLDHGRSRRPFLLAAAAVLVVAAIAAGLVLASRDDGGQDQVVAGPPEDPGLEDPAGIVGRSWTLTRLVREGTELPIPSPDQYDPPTFGIADDGQVTFRGCNGGGAQGRVTGGRIELDGEVMQTLMACGGEEGEALMALDDAMGVLLRQGPAIELSGDRLTLRSEDVEAHFVERPGGRPGSGDSEPDDPATDADVQMVPSGDVPCAVGIDRSIDPGRSWALGPGPAEPPVLDSGWYDGQATQGVWNLADGNQRIEVHAPGFIVRDLVGARTEEVLLGEKWSATAWFTNDWVQIRNFGGGPPGSICSSFTVTVTGSTEAENRDTAVAISRALVIEEHQTPETTSDPTVEGGTTPGAGGGMPPDVPSADEGQDADLGPSSDQGGRWTLEQVVVDGYRRPALVTPLGGDGTGGPIVLDTAPNDDGLVLRGCDIEPVALQERDGRPRVNLEGNSSTAAGCTPGAGDQWGQVLKILSLGAVPRTVETERGPVLVIENEEGTAAFWRP